MGFENIALWDAMKSAKYRQSIEELEGLIDDAEDLDVAIRDSLALVCKAIHAEVGTFWVYNDHGDGLIRAKATYGGSNLDGIRLLPGEGVCGQVIESGTSTIIIDCQKDERWAGRVDQKTGFVTSSMICSPLSYKGLSFACIQIINKDDNTLYDQKDLTFIDNLTEIIVQCFARRNMIANFLSGVSSKQQANFGVGKSTNVTTMFVEIAGFTSLFDEIGLEKSVAVLNAFLIYVTAVIKENGGFIDKYMGDKVMALWGAPNETVDSELKAVKTAIQINKNKQDLIDKIKASYGVELNFKITVNVGIVYAGVIGESELADYTVTGESVNIGYKMLTITQANDILVTQDVIKGIGAENIKVSSVKDGFEYKSGKSRIPVFKVISVL